jgi:hypothetical protein
MTWGNARARVDPLPRRPFAGTGVTALVASGFFWSPWKRTTTFYAPGQTRRFSPSRNPSGAWPVNFKALIRPLAEGGARRARGRCSRLRLVIARWEPPCASGRSQAGFSGLSTISALRVKILTIKYNATVTVRCCRYVKRPTCAIRSLRNRLLSLTEGVTVRNLSLAGSGRHSGRPLSPGANASTPTYSERGAADPQPGFHFRSSDPAGNQLSRTAGGVYVEGQSRRAVVACLPSSGRRAALRRVGARCHRTYSRGHEANS